MTYGGNVESGDMMVHVRSYVIQRSIIVMKSIILTFLLGNGSVKGCGTPFGVS